MSLTYHLSCSLTNNRYSIRDIACYNNNTIATCEEKNTVRIYSRSSNNKFNDLKLFPKSIHDNMIFCIEPVYDLDQPTFVSGGDDHAVQIYNADGKFFPSINGFEKQICSISQLYNNNADLLVGCWDGCAYLYNKISGKCIKKISGHQYATVVCTTPNGFVTASANKEIHIYNNEYMQVCKIKNAHNHVIKRLSYHPILNCIVSAGNDGYISLWSLDGSKLNSWEAHYKSKNDKGDDQDAFIFGLCVDKNGRIYSSGEDRAVRVWEADGSLVAEIMHPGSVMSVKVMENGDVFTGCGDRVARIFTTDPTRFAELSELEGYESCINAMGSSNVESINIDNLPDSSVLSKPGKNHGQTIVVNVAGRGAIVYSWNGDENTWIEVGEAIAKSNSSGMSASDSSGKNIQPKHELHGKKWDRVVPVESDTNGNNLMLGFDIDEDADEITERFMKQNQFPPDYFQQIKEFVKPMLDPDARRKKLQAMHYQRGDEFKQTPAWKSPYIAYSETNFPVMKQKLIDFNSQLAQTEYALSDSETRLLPSFMHNLSDQVNYHVSTFPNEQFDLLKKLLSWPTEKVLPVLDSLRILFLHHAACETLLNSFLNDSRFCGLVFNHILNGTDNHMVFGIRVVTNLVARKKRTNEERLDGIPDGKLIDFLMKSMDVFSPASTSTNKTILTSYSTLCYNIISWVGRFHIPDCPLYEMVAFASTAILSQPQELDEKVVYYSLVTIGTVGLSCESSTIPLLKNNFSEIILKAITKFNNSKNQAIQEACQDLRSLLQI